MSNCNTCVNSFQWPAVQCVCFTSGWLDVTDLSLPLMFHEACMHADAAHKNVSEYIAVSLRLLCSVFKF